MLEYTKRFETRYKVPMNAFSPFFYANLQVLFAGMKKAGTVTDTDTVRDAMLGLIQFETVLGKVGWTGQAQWKSNQQLDAPFYVALLKGGVPHIVAKCNPTRCE